MGGHKGDRGTRVRRTCGRVAKGEHMPETLAYLGLTKFILTLNRPPCSSRWDALCATARKFRSIRLTDSPNRS